MDVVAVERHPVAGKNSHSYTGWPMPSNPPHRIGAGGLRWKQWPPDVAACWVLILALWLATRPYRGIIHDAQLYAVHALAALKPAAFASDIYLRFGTQAP